MSDDLSRSLDRTRWALRLAYLAVLLLATLTDLEPVLDPAAAAERLGGALTSDPARPLTPRDLVDGARNVLLFAGWGLVWMLTARAGGTLRALGLAVGSGVAISVGVETAQLLSDTRNASALDVLANGGGALLGATAVIVTVRALSSRRERRSFVGLPIAVFAGGYGAAVLGEAFIPLLRQDRLAVWGSPIARFAHAVREFDPASLTLLPFSELVLFAPAGFFATAALVEAGRGYRGAAAIVALGGGGLVLVAELARGAVSLAIPGGPMIVHVLGIAAGAAAAAVLLPPMTRHLRRAARPQALMLVYAWIVAMWFLRPYVLEVRPAAWAAELTGGWWMPMAFAAERMDLFSVIDVMNVFFLFLPIGGLLAVWPVRRSGTWSGILPGIALAVLVEASQVFMAGRTLSAADMLIASAAVWTGWVLLRRSGFPVRGELATAAGRRP